MDNEQIRDPGLVSNHAAQSVGGARQLFPQFRELLRDRGALVALSSETRIATCGSDELFYTPFEHVEVRARLVLVGITPGPTQISLAYAEAQRQIAAGRNDVDVLRETKKIAAFGGPSMRPNLIRMLDAIGIPQIVGAERAANLWDRDARLLHATSVVPHAALRAAKPFAGSLADIRGSRPLRECFERDFLPSLAPLAQNAFFVALGPTPLAALDFAATLGILDASRILGALAHPSSNGGSQVDIYLGLRNPDDLKAGDPVRRRINFLLPAALRMRAAIARLLRTGATASPRSSEQGATEPVLAAPPAAPQTSISSKALAAPVPAVNAQLASAPDGLHYIVERGANAGKVLRPHVHMDGCVVVSPTRFEKDYIRLAEATSAEMYLARGYGLRMSGPGVSPSLVRAASIRGRMP